MGCAGGGGGGGGGGASTHHSVDAQLAQRTDSHFLSLNKEVGIVAQLRLTIQRQMHFMADPPRQYVGPVGGILGAAVKGDQRVSGWRSGPARR